MLNQKGKDFVAALPVNRKQQYKEAFRNNKLRIVGVSLLIGLFFSIFLVLYFFKSAIVANMLNQITETTASETALQIVVDCMWTEVYFMIGIIVALMIGFTGIIAGIHYFKTMIFGAGVKFKQDFFKNIKPSIKYGALIGLINGLVLLILKVTVYLLTIYALDYQGIAGIVISVIIYLILFGIDMYLISMIPFYKLTFKQFFQNGFLLYFAKFGWNLLMTIAMFGLLIFALVFQYSIVTGIVFGLYIFGGFGLTFLGCSIYTQIEFDFYINSQYAPELINNGLYVNKQNTGDAYEGKN